MYPFEGEKIPNNKIWSKKITYSRMDALDSAFSMTDLSQKLEWVDL